MDADDRIQAADQALLTSLEQWMSEMTDQVPVNDNAAANASAVEPAAEVKNPAVDGDEMPELADLLSQPGTMLIPALSEALSKVLTPIWTASDDASAAFEHHLNSLVDVRAKEQLQQHVQDRIQSEIGNMEQQVDDLCQQMSKVSVKDVSLRGLLDMVETAAEVQAKWAEIVAEVVDA